MTEKQIIQMVKEHFTEEWCEEDGDGWVEFSGKPSDFLKFARAIRQDGYSEGFEEGIYQESYNNSMSYLGD